MSLQLKYLIISNYYFPSLLSKHILLDFIGENNFISFFIYEKSCTKDRGVCISRMQFIWKQKHQRR